MACPAQSMLSASGCILLRSKPRASSSHVRGGIIGGGCSSRPFQLTCNASSSPSPPSPAPAQEDPDCNDEECAPEKEVLLLLFPPWTWRASLVAQP
ncbi:proline-rich family protein [Zea mays]|jgi:hypothetical protein|uniref:Proline-rich family protein n=1 Tax=Zea mays TaxID=4577 RepID=A0A1D6Q383_MAIZE|nr:proline-rich family protein [Zea mays]